MAVMLTTVDNPFDPFTQFDEWLEFDLSKGYNSCELLARIAKFPRAFTENLAQSEMERAIDEIVEVNASGMHRKVYDTSAT